MKLTIYFKHPSVEAWRLWGDAPIDTAFEHARLLRGEGYDIVANNPRGEQVYEHKALGVSRTPDSEAGHSHDILIEASDA